MMLFLRTNCLGQSRGINFIDSTHIKVCHNRRIHSHKVFDEVAERGQCSLGWFYGFKQKAVTQFRDQDIDTEVIRLVDHDVKPGIESDMGNGDEWPAILNKIKACDIFVIATPVWMGHIASTTQRLIERLDAIFHDEELSDPNTGQFFTYNKVAGCLITGNEDGAHACAAQILWAMQESGFTIPPNVNAYWVGMAGAGKDYVEAGGEQWYYTNYTLRYMTANLVWFAKLLKANPISTNLNELKELAKKESPR